MNTKHTVIVHHFDGECSTEGEFADRASAVLEASIIAGRLVRGEYVTACGYSFGPEFKAEVRS
jgi:hypothetical protein